MYCPNCGTYQDDHAWSCLQCGAALRHEGYAPSEQQTSGKAIASLVFSVAGLFFCLFLGQIIGIMLGYEARKEIAASHGRLTGEELATAGIIVGWVGIVIDSALVMLWILFVCGGLIAAGM
jgi:hypothetical protein